jgi:hypothetical protein
VKLSLLFISGICIGIVGIENRAEAHNYPCVCEQLCCCAAPRTAAKSHLSVRRCCRSFFFVGLRNFKVPKSRKYRCCIRIESAKENGQAKLVLFIKGRQVEAPTEKHTALLDCLHKNRGLCVSAARSNTRAQNISKATTARLAAVRLVDR